MGEASNTKISGQGRMAALCHAGKLDERYKGKVFDQLTASDQLAIDQAYDALLKDVRTTLKNKEM